MTILLTVLSVGLTQMDRINASINPQVLYKAHLLTNVVMHMDSSEIDLISEYEVDGYKVKKRIERIGDDLKLIELSVYNGLDKLVYTRQYYKFCGVEI